MKTVKFKTFAEFKRNLTVGKNLQSTFHLNIKKDATGKNMYDAEGKVIFEPRDNGARPITIVQSNSIALKTTKPDGNVVDSWFYYPKASEVEIINEDTLNVYEIGIGTETATDKTLVLSYQILETV